ncbi:protein of unknown function [Magnetospirillum gryphiswaldense MSR-1 v2]|uniref:Uncharacterized protein n=1 Tax=Magnetospirillum gryphiswaldense (strain DSM 6361 / JCM 21280 / NBRC 15271 / MSR-1) TaxID=431944 RepID=V6F570_MAGGM|nr:protein of unknown function [Magnetospirillum gryphiswaldense MSR-1 v2]
MTTMALGEGGNPFHMISTAAAAAKAADAKVMAEKRIKRVVILVSIFR